ncbi:MAG: hypothetical protein WC456_03735 [Patescibacteria group bacterium]
MTDKELIARLNSLKNISPDQNWLKSNRELLLSQVSNSGAEKLAVWKIVLIDFTSAMKAISRPAYALGAFVLMLLSGAMFSQQLLAGAKPNDSLYIARIISEQVKLNTTFNTETRDKLAVQFATSHAQDISAVLADPEFNTEANREQVAKLNDSFKAEVNMAKDRISRLPSTVKKAPVPVPAALDDVVIAENSKDGQGIELFEKTETAVTPAEPGTGTVAASTTPEASSTAGIETGAAATAETETGSSEADKVLEEATKLFDQKDYTKAADKLKEVDEIIK